MTPFGMNISNPFILTRTYLVYKASLAAKGRLKLKTKQPTIS